MRKTIILISSFLLFCFFSALTFGVIPSSERAALIALYNSTNGDSWSDNTGWKDGTLEADGFGPIGSEGTWYGITVASDHVTNIALWSNQLTGSITAELGNLTNLKFLFLDKNQLTGSIPTELGNLINLYSLYLHSNQLTGSIPAELGNMTNLIRLRLGFNQLTGSIPVELGNLTNLKILNLYSNQLTGSIPTELGNLTNLIYLGLDINQLTGSIPAELGNLINLVTLRLDENRLTGSIPAELGNLTNLECLFLYYNQLTGSIPTELGNLTNLKDFSLWSNQLTGSIPSKLGNLKNLVYLNLSHNQLTGRIPVELSNLTNLEFLRLDGNQLTGRIPKELGNLTNLENFDLDSNQLTGRIPAKLGNLTNLLNLHLQYNQLSGEIPTTLTNLINLNYLDIGYNCLYTNDSALKSWLDTHDPDWEDFQCDTEYPFGSFDTPIDESTVRSSIPVTGWALDNWGIDTIKIYRAQGNTLLYIGDAVLVKGARPDVAAQYPEYPNNTKAGWGYMMLTNFLPNGGNGTFVIHAIATDISGKTITLGSKTIHCDNSHAVKPFGAIDTPGQGSTASGSSFDNWGWALTPQPNSIPTDGSTISVFVDSVNIGNPTYNVYRADIATLFPGYANSNGAVGHFSLDTTAYYNGVHTIFWTAIDSGGNADGIGSRYFFIQNSGSSMSESKIAGNNQWNPTINIEELSNLPFNYFEPIKMKKGYRRNIQSKIIQLDEENTFKIEIRELERIEIQLSNVKTGYMSAGNKIHPLPLGSTLETKNGKFSWIPGPGFYGNYRLVFIMKDENGDLSKIEILIRVVPKFGLKK